MTGKAPAPEADLPAPRWIRAEDMPSMPRAWYWAAFPGSWVFYAPQRNSALSIDNGDTRWHALGSVDYWGPWTPPQPPSPGPSP